MVRDILVEINRTTLSIVELGSRLARHRHPSGEYRSAVLAVCMEQSNTIFCGRRGYVSEKEAKSTCCENVNMSEIF